MGKLLHTTRWSRPNLQNTAINVSKQEIAPVEVPTTVINQITKCGEGISNKVVTLKTQQNMEWRKQRN